MTHRSLTGVLPVVQTPFAPDGSIDLNGLESELAWMFAQGVSGAVTGMVSETLRLSESERRDLARVVCEGCAAADRVAIISSGAESTYHAVRFAAHARELGADAVMVIPPTTVALGDDELFGYYGAILDAIDIPVIVQDASGYIGQPLTIELQTRLLGVYGDRVLYKPEAAPIGPRLSQLRDATGGKARVFEGSGGAAVLDSYRRGIVGTMPGTEVCWAVQALWEACERGDWDTAYRISGPLALLVAMEVSVEAYVSIEKHLLVRQGVFNSAAVREPVGYTFDADTKAEVDRLFDRLAEAVNP